MNQQLTQKEGREQGGKGHPSFPWSRQRRRGFNYKGIGSGLVEKGWKSVLVEFSP